MTLENDKADVLTFSKDSTSEGGTIGEIFLDDAEDTHDVA
jgi:hypothetical protein